MFPPIEISLYNENDELIAKFERNIIPWGLLKKAITIQKQLNAPAPVAKKWWEIWKSDETTSAEEAQMRAISQFVVELFSNKFSIKQLEAGADIGEIMTVFQTVISRANSAVKTNPTRKPSFKK